MPSLYWGMGPGSTFTVEFVHPTAKEEEDIAPGLETDTDLPMTQGWRFDNDADSCDGGDARGPRVQRGGDFRATSKCRAVESLQPRTATAMATATNSGPLPMPPPLSSPSPHGPHVIATAATATAIDTASNVAAAIAIAAEGGSTARRAVTQNHHRAVGPALLPRWARPPSHESASSRIAVLVQRDDRRHHRANSNNINNNGNDYDDKDEEGRRYARTNATTSTMTTNATTTTTSVTCGAARSSPSTENWSRLDNEISDCSASSRNPLSDVSKVRQCVWAGRCEYASSAISTIREDFTTHPGLAPLRPPDERSTTASIHSAATSALSSLVMEEMEALYPDDNQKEKTATSISVTCASRSGGCTVSSEYSMLSMNDIREFRQ
ncbi:hypothetical protein ACHAW5_000544 [Stephanodiscus triporus]|uniref:Uncharacterized protein n=1 Tax=Stephanodiscus triporus TaxID=2934178 RepID=A0ABD3PT04_9STRA